MNQESKKYLILLCSQTSQSKFNVGEKKVKLELLVKIKRILLSKSIDYEIATIGGKRPLINFEKDDIYKEWAREEQDKLVNPVNFNGADTKTYLGLILLDLPGFYDEFYCTFPSEYESFKDAIISTQSQNRQLMNDFTTHCKSILVFGNGILPLFFAINEKAEWALKGLYISSIPLSQEIRENYFSEIPITIEEGIRSLGGNFIPGNDQMILKNEKFIFARNHQCLIETLSLSLTSVSQSEH